MENNTIRTSPTNSKQVKAKKPPYLFNGEELMNLPITQIPCMWEPFFIQQGLISLTGGSDVGKSSFLRQLALSVVLKKNSFLGSPLNVRYGRAIYLATEDNQATASISIKRGIDTSIKPSDLKNLCYLINPDDPLRAIEEQLKIAKTDVVIVDSFGDVFSGNLNDNNAVRTILNKYQRLAEKYDVLFIFLHHTGKRTENNSPSKNNVIGSQGFEAKMRLVMELRKPDNSSRRDLHFTKGNHLSDAIKSQAMQLLFDNKQQFQYVGHNVASSNQVRTFSEDAEEKVLKIAVPLRAKGMTIDKIREELIKMDLPKVPSKGKLHGMLSAIELGQSA